MTLLQSGLAKSLAEDYTIDQSLRFNAADADYLERTAGTPTDGKKLTASVWVKGPSTVGGGVMLEARSTDWDWWGITGDVNDASADMRCFLYGAQSRADGADAAIGPKSQVCDQSGLRGGRANCAKFSLINSWTGEN